MAFSKRGVKKFENKKKIQNKNVKDAIQIIKYVRGPYFGAWQAECE